MKEKLINRLKSLNKRSHTIRIIAGAYLVYTAYEIFSEMQGAPRPAFVIFAGVFFAVAGAFFCVTSLYAYNNFYYAEAAYAEDDENEISNNGEADSCDIENKSVDEGTKDSN